MTRRPSAAGSRDTAGVIAPPPVLFGAALGAALLLHYAALPLRIVSRWGPALASAGAALAVLGLALSAAVMRVFGNAGTAVPPYKPTTRFVSTGPYRFSRNPDYVGQTLLYVGLALVLNTWWPLILLPPVLVVVQLGVVRREERYLERKFGQEYLDYKRRVRRWL